MSHRIANVTDAGARRRRLGGIIWLVIALAALAGMVVTKSPHSWRAFLLLPFGLAAAGFLQAREKT
jgi:hypothetical protein